MVHREVVSSRISDEVIDNYDQLFDEGRSYSDMADHASSMDDHALASHLRARARQQAKADRADATAPTPEPAGDDGFDAPPVNRAAPEDVRTDG